MLGVGVEFAFTNSISGKLEKQLHGLRHTDVHVHHCSGWRFFQRTLDAEIRQNIHLVKVNLNFRWDNPVVARY